MAVAAIDPSGVRGIPSAVAYFSLGALWQWDRHRATQPVAYDTGVAPHVAEERGQKSPEPELGEEEVADEPGPSQSNLHLADEPGPSQSSLHLADKPSNLIGLLAHQVQGEWLSGLANPQCTPFRSPFAPSLLLDFLFFCGFYF